MQEKSHKIDEQEVKFSPQKRATIVSSSVAFMLICVKFVAGVLSGSVAVLASAIDSMLDFCTSLFNLFAITKSEKPADSNFNYGFGKIESLACVVEGTVILVSGIFIVYQSVKKLILGEELAHVDFSIYIMGFSLVVTTLLVIYLSYVAKKSGNLVIKADALHYKSDILSNGSVLAALFLIKYSGFQSIDAIFGICVGIYIGYSAISLLKEGVLELLDRSLEDRKIQAIKDILDSNEGVLSYHDFKTRRSAGVNFVEVHLVLDSLISLHSAHDIAESIEQSIKALQFETKEKWVVITHLDPYDDEGM